MTSQHIAEFALLPLSAVIMNNELATRSGARVLRDRFPSRPSVLFTTVFVQDFTGFFKQRLLKHQSMSSQVIILRLEAFYAFRTHHRPCKHAGCRVLPIVLSAHSVSLPSRKKKGRQHEDHLEPRRPAAGAAAPVRGHARYVHAVRWSWKTELVEFLADSPSHVTAPFNVRCMCGCSRRRGNDLNRRETSSICNYLSGRMAK